MAESFLGAAQTALRELREFLGTVEGRRRLNHEVDQQIAKRRALARRINALKMSSLLPSRQAAEASTHNIAYKLELVRMLFDSFNMDGNEAMDPVEMEALLHELGVETNSAERAEFIAALDTDGSGDVDFDEFKAMVVSGLDEHGHVIDSTSGLGAVSDAAREFSADSLRGPKIS